MPLVVRAATLVMVLLIPMAAVAQAPVDHREEERAILADLVSTNSTSGTPGVQRLAQRISARLLTAGFAPADMQSVGPTPLLRSLLVRYRGRAAGKPPILVMAHLDVVAARREDWDTDPFAFAERDGWYYGRGVEDNKAGLAAIVATFARWKRAKWVPERDIIAVLSADEETDGLAMQWLMRERPELRRAEYALNTDAGGVALDHGRAVSFALQASEKVFANFSVEAINPGGHSSIPRADNAIYDLAAALTRIGAFRFPARLNDVTRGFFREAAASQAPDVAALMRALAAEPMDSAAAAVLSARNDYFSSLLRTTCVATRLSGGHADNALPQRATALVNCRMLPDDPTDAVRAELQRVAGSGVRVAVSGPVTPSPVSPLQPQIMAAVTELAREEFPGVPIVPDMSTGASDGLYVRNAGVPTYGISALAFEQDAPSRAHGKDERIDVASFHQSVTFWDRLVRRLADTRAAAGAL